MQACLQEAEIERSTFLLCAPLSHQKRQGIDNTLSFPNHSIREVTREVTNQIFPVFSPQDSANAAERNQKTL